MLPQLSIRIDLPDGSRLGPGKIRLLRAIQTEGSIVAAARLMGMSYPKASRLVGELNASFDKAVVVTAAGGASRGGATLSDMGEHVLQIYDEMVQQALQATVAGRESLATALKER